MGGRRATVARPLRACLAAAQTGREIVIPPGGCTGWHFHRVELYALVVAGTLTRVLHDGSIEVHRAGTTFVEPAGIGHIHLGHNLGSEPVVLHVTPVLPPGTPFSIPTPPPASAAPEVCRSHQPAYLPAHPVEAS
uniref:Cupin domain-containing protein n=1 Tax=Streptomyces sp. NBC_00049 TaxID=2903617 RepID=A0AAU2JNE8_9ACTN